MNIKQIKAASFFVWTGSPDDLLYSKSAILPPDTFTKKKILLCVIDISKGKQ